MNLRKGVIGGSFSKRDRKPIQLDSELFFQLVLGLYRKPVEKILKSAKIRLDFKIKKP